MIPHSRRKQLNLRFPVRWNCLQQRHQIGWSHYIHQICRPLLIGQGANDPRVKQTESDQIVRAMQEKNIPVTYVLFSDEGHGFARPENRLSFIAVAEAFLANHLGGRHEPIKDAFKGSSISIPVGAETIPGLAGDRSIDQRASSIECCNHERSKPDLIEFAAHPSRGCSIAVFPTFPLVRTE